MRWLGGTTLEVRDHLPEVRDHLPDGMAGAGDAWDGVPLRAALAVRLSEGLGGTAAHAR